MFRQGHTIYFDITQRCNVGCEFCMYAKQHDGIELNLTKTGKDNIRNLFQRKDIKQISISGEGEPLYKQSTFFEILALSSGYMNFEIITSGAFSESFFLPILKKTNSMMASKNDSCNIRLSSDSYHISKVPYISHGYCINYFLKERPSNLTLSFRSIDVDRKKTNSFLLEQLEKYAVHGKIEYVDLLTDKLITQDMDFDVIYKNVVEPLRLNLTSYMDIYEYIDALEDKYARPFTLGSMNKFPSPNGLDITIKPDGEMCFYGIEPYHLGNILKEPIDFEEVLNLVASEDILAYLHEQPFREVLNKLSHRSDFKKIIHETNNPYWILKNISRQFSWQEVRTMLL